MNIAVVAIGVYQALDRVKHDFIMTFFGYSAVCKHRPTCSQFTLQQIKQHGTIRGLLAGLRRIATCW